MISVILEALSSFILFIIKTCGYAGIFLLMTLQSFNIPIPSEVTMPFSGFLVSRGVFNFWAVVLFGALGNLLGGFLSYRFAEAFIKNGLREKYKFLKFLINENNLETAERWFKKYGSVSVFIGRMVPVVSTFISFAAGLSKMNRTLFLVFTFFGSALWSLGLTWIGYVLGQNWIVLGAYFRKFDYLILGIILIVVVVWFVNHFKGSRQPINN